MTILEFIRENVAELNRIILERCPNIDTLDDDEREDWILNDEGLYTWAQSCGVDI